MFRFENPQYLTLLLALAVLVLLHYYAMYCQKRNLRRYGDPELLKDLRLSYNKARQAAITNEIIEIVSGSEALKG